MAYLHNHFQSRGNSFFFDKEFFKEIVPNPIKGVGVNNFQ
jgi:hypothetical protein